MSKQTSKLRFDINRLMSSNINDNDFIGPYPGDSEDSLIQSYFYRPPQRGADGEPFAPMRFDIFSQGLRLDQIELKKEEIKEIFSDVKVKHSYKDPNDSSVLPRLIPTGFDLLDGKPEKNIEEEIINRIKDRMHELRGKI